FGGYISMGQILSTPMIVLGILMMVWAYKRGLYQDKAQVKTK
ncbi:prolipoprotein diacylglyceryl transferase, partial [Escherichia coli]|nr:prolipoprotein diacylglyceryl transferase [Escherichia coli]